MNTTKTLYKLAYQPKIKFLGKRLGVPAFTQQNSTLSIYINIAPLPPYVHVKSTFKRTPFSAEETEAINFGPAEVQWKKVKPIQI